MIFSELFFIFIFFTIRWVKKVLNKQLELAYQERNKVPG